MIVASRPDFVSYFSKAWKEMGFFGQVLVPSECDHIPAEPDQFEKAPLVDALRRADLFIFEFGYLSQKPEDPIRTGRLPSAADVKALSLVEAVFKRTASSEANTRPVTRRTPRRFVGINVINNVAWDTFSTLINATLTPFCCQVAAGFAYTGNSGQNKRQKWLQRLNPFAGG